MVKVSSVAKDTGRVWAHLTYITRNGRIVAETDSGQVLTCLDDIRELNEYWSECPGKRRSNGKLAVNIVLSMPAGTNVERLASAVRAFSQDAFVGHEYAFVLHTPDTDPDPDAPPHPHAHICVRAGAVNGRRLRHGPPELQAFRQLFAEKLREQGIEAAATPRSIRGVVKKQKPQSLYHAAKGRRSTVQASKLRQAAKAVLNGEQVDGVWEHQASQKQKEVREGWLTLAKGLETSERSNDTVLARDIKYSVDNLPALLTERQETAKKMSETLNRQRSKDTSPETPSADSRSATVKRSRTAPTRRNSPGESDHER
ncbi:hypothetical protein WJ542_01980 [Paraburkholderia sp. B3]|uniref:relaxase/mobilization nuclease domain-containing protein n=1 Tax=Paraburkholderia sp. B3 TaxID=3134791 RepID=UPI0039819F2E